MSIEMWAAYRTCEACEVSWFGPQVCWSCGRGGPRRVTRAVAGVPMQNPATWRGSDVA